MRDPGPLSSFAAQAYLAPLRTLQNKDGGWGFNAGGESRVEPTAWALLALQEFSSPAAMDAVLERGVRFLIEAQLEDGSWAAASGQQEGCWVTSLACWALLAQGQYATSLVNGLLWLNNDRPRDSGFCGGWRAGYSTAGESAPKALLLAVGVGLLIRQVGLSPPATR
jgi:hypothetical protein